LEHADWSPLSGAKPKKWHNPSFSGFDPSWTSPDPLQRVGSERGSSMPVALLNTLIIPVQALAWLGRQGTRAIAALVFIDFSSALHFVHARGYFDAA
jgi:hypothetical protein